MVEDELGRTILIGQHCQTQNFTSECARVGLTLLGPEIKAFLFVASCEHIIFGGDRTSRLLCVLFLSWSWDDESVACMKKRVGPLEFEFSLKLGA